jgi:hypothetical protein
MRHVDFNAIRSQNGTYGFNALSSQIRNVDFNAVASQNGAGGS